MAKDILKPVNVTDSPSPSIKRAAQEPENWRQLGQTPEEALADRHTKHPVDPKDNK